MQKVLIIPCSGIGKVQGSISRLSAYYVVDELRPETTTMTCLPLLVAGDPEASLKVKNHRCITIEGCPLRCAEKTTKAVGGQHVMSLTVLEAYRKHRELKIGLNGVLNLGTDDKKLAKIIAEEIALNVDKSSPPEEVKERDDHE
jgi:uncharacterized metal-binding protein